MEFIFYSASAIALISTILVISSFNGVHALLYLVVSLLSVAMIFFTLGAPFLAALQVIIYAGAIVVLFTFVVMMLNQGKEAAAGERQLLTPGVWAGPSILCLILLFQLFFLLNQAPTKVVEAQKFDPEAVGIALFGPYILGVEIAAMLLMAGLVAAYHIGRRKKQAVHRYLKDESHGNIS